MDHFETSCPELRQLDKLEELLDQSYSSFLTCPIHFQIMTGIVAAEQSIMSLPNGQLIAHPLRIIQRRSKFKSKSECK